MIIFGLVVLSFLVFVSYFAVYDMLEHDEIGAATSIAFLVAMGFLHVAIRFLLDRGWM